MDHFRVLGKHAVELIKMFLVVVERQDIHASRLYTLELNCLRLNKRAALITLHTGVSDNCLGVQQ